MSFWQFTLRAVPIVVAIASTSVLGYFLFSERSQPYAQLQQEPQEQPAQPAPQPEAQDQLLQAQVQQPQAQMQVQQPQAQMQVQQPQAQAQVQQPQAQVQEPEPPVPNPLPPMPTDDKLVILINSALIALNQANATGNYTVLRDFAAPGFKRANSPERLAQIFANLRSRNLDLSPVILYQPKLYRKPEMNAKGMVRIGGFFPTSPDRVNFNLIFQPMQGQWRLYGIAVNPQHVQPARAAPAPRDAPAQTPAAESPEKPATAQVVKPAAPAKKPVAEPKATEETVAEPQVDIRDRIDNPPPPPPAEKPKERSIWNPFSR